MNIHRGSTELAVDASVFVVDAWPFKPSVGSWLANRLPAPEAQTAPAVVATPRKKVPSAATCTDTAVFRSGRAVATPDGRAKRSVGGLHAGANMGKKPTVASEARAQDAESRRRELQQPRTHTSPQVQRAKSARAKDAEVKKSAQEKEPKDATSRKTSPPACSRTRRAKEPVEQNAREIASATRTRPATPDKAFREVTVSKPSVTRSVGALACKQSCQKPADAVVARRPQSPRISLPKSSAPAAASAANTDAGKPSISRVRASSVPRRDGCQAGAAAATYGGASSVAPSAPKTQSSRMRANSAPRRPNSASRISEETVATEGYRATTAAPRHSLPSPRKTMKS